VRLFVNDKPVIDDWDDTTAGEHTGSIMLRQGRRYNFRIEYVDRSGPASLQLMWSSAAIPKSLIPRSQLYPQ
jgi:hypothetical protein